ncbi:hypothetical protein SRHO_G00030420 [Serrasalmus rhombeus]
MIQLSQALGEKALQVLVNLPTEQHDELTVLTMALHQWFGKAMAVQSVRKLLQDEWRLEVERTSILVAGLSTVVRAVVQLQAMVRGGSTPGVNCAKKQLCQGRGPERRLGRACYQRVGTPTPQHLLWPGLCIPQGLCSNCVGQKNDCLLGVGLFDVYHRLCYHRGSGGAPMQRGSLEAVHSW